MPSHRPQDHSSIVAQTAPSLDASSLDAALVACTDTVTFTEVVEGETWGSFYSSYKVSILPTSDGTVLL